MNIKKVLAGLAIASMLVACGNSSTKKETANYSKVGYAINTEVDGRGRVNTTMAVVGLDNDGKIAYVSIDVAQQNPTGENESLKTKKEKGPEYGMLNASGIEKEWYEQIEALENHFIGMNVADIKAIEIYETGSTNSEVPAEGTDLAAEVTVNISEYRNTVIEAIENAVAVDGIDKVGMGQEVSLNAARNQVSTTISFVALDKDGAIVWSLVDVAQTVAEDGVEALTKHEQGADYGMLAASEANGIGKEWFEQAEAFSTHVLGKKLAEIKAIETYGKDDSHSSVPTEGTDLAAVVTIDVGHFLESLIEAINNAK